MDHVTLLQWLKNFSKTLFLHVSDKTETKLLLPFGPGIHICGTLRGSCRTHLPHACGPDNVTALFTILLCQMEMDPKPRLVC